MSNPIRVAIVGMGSCASSFVQAVAEARGSHAPGAGISHPLLSGYTVGDIDVVAAFDVDARKIGEDVGVVATSLTDAATHVPVPTLNVEVEAGPLCDGLIGPLATRVPVDPRASERTTESVAERLRAARVEVMICLVPTGATRAVRTYAASAAAARVAFVNGTPEQAANDLGIAQLFADRGVPLLGDDMRSHFGATTLHTSLLDLLRQKGIIITHTHQLNIGGNTDFLNLSDPERAASKVRTKCQALSAAGLGMETVLAGPSGFAPTLGDRKICHLSVEGLNVLGSPLRLDVRLEVEDSPNAAGILVNAVRAARVALDRGLSGVVYPVCPALFKAAPRGASATDGLRMFDEFFKEPTPARTFAADAAVA